MSHDNDLIFDLGFFDGSDTRYYLDKGFRVVAVEADHRAVARATRDFHAELASGTLTLLERAVWKDDGATVPFYLDQREDSAFHSVYRDVAERDGGGAVVHEVETVTIPTLFDVYGVPRYVKCDIEGADAIVVEQIGADGRLPPFLSIEIFERELIHGLGKAGYDRFQLVNQGHLSKFRQPRPAREGRTASVVFGGAHSGLFGRDLPMAHWCDEDTCVRRFDRWKRMKMNYGLIPRVQKHIARMGGWSWLDCTGWMDLHVTTREQLGML